MRKASRWLLGSVGVAVLLLSSSQIYQHHVKKTHKRELATLVGACGEFHLASEMLKRSPTLENASDAQIKSEYALAELATSRPGESYTFGNWPLLKHYIHDANECIDILNNNTGSTNYSLFPDYSNKISWRRDLACDLQRSGGISSTNWNRLLLWGTSFQSRYGPAEITGYSNLGKR